MKNLLENIIKTVLFEQVAKVTSLKLKEFDLAIKAGAVFAFEVTSKGVTKPSAIINNIIGGITSNNTVGASSKYAKGNYFYIVSDPIQDDKRQKIVVWIYPNGGKYGTFDTLRINYAKMGLPDAPSDNKSTVTNQPDIKRSQDTKEISVKYKPENLGIRYIGQSPIMNRAVYDRVLSDLKKEDPSITGVNTIELQSKENILVSKNNDAAATQSATITTEPTTTITTTTPTSSVSTITTPTDEQIKLAKEYRIWANSTPTLKKKYGKTSPYDLDATSSTPWNTYFTKSYEAGKTEFEQRTTVATPPVVGRKTGDTITLKPGSVNLYYKKNDKFTETAKISAGADLSKNKVTIKDISGNYYYVTIGGKSYWINKSSVK